MKANRSLRDAILEAQAEAGYRGLVAHADTPVAVSVLTTNPLLLYRVGARAYSCASQKNTSIRLYHAWSQLSRTIILIHERVSYVGSI